MFFILPVMNMIFYNHAQFIRQALWHIVSVMKQSQDAGDTRFRTVRTRCTHPRRFHWREFLHKPVLRR
jgi:hypothetical protein